MQDEQILARFFARDEEAIRLCQKQYGAWLQRLAENLLGSAGEAEECVSDAYLGAWNSIPPGAPERLGAYLARLTRRSAVDVLRARSREKRGGGAYEAALEELADCLPAAGTPQTQLESEELGRIIADFVRALPDATRRLFVGRYFYAWPLEPLAKQLGMSQSAAKSRLFRTRQALRARLEQEGISL